MTGFDDEVRMGDLKHRLSEHASLRLSAHEPACAMVARS
jgi:hypothetical protein